MSDASEKRRPARTIGPAMDLVPSKLFRPALRPGTVGRRDLVEQLGQRDTRPVVSLVAPAGYGKTTVLSQWAATGWQRFAWLSLDEGDNDPRVMLTYIAEALDAVEPIDERVFEALAFVESSVPGSVIPRLGAAFRSLSTPTVLVLDDVDVLRNLECRAAVSVLADNVPMGSRLVLAGRADPPLRVGRLRAQGRILEIGRRELSLTSAEASLLLLNAEVALDADEAAELFRRTEGWPVGLYLAALFVREGGSVEGAADSFSGSDRFLREYVESELLERISGRERAFLMRTAVLERMCGPLCDAILDQTDSAGTLAALARSNLLLVPLDGGGEWYRYHQLFRDMLMAELDRSEPDLILLLRRRAAGWCADHGPFEDALEYFLAAGDVDAVASMFEGLWAQVLFQGRETTLRRWVRWLEEQGGVAEHPMVAVAAMLSAIVFGRPADAEGWARWVERWQSQEHDRPEDLAVQAWATLFQAELCRHGIEQMRADADEAARLFSGAEGFMVPLSATLQGIACLLSGDVDGGDALLAAAAAAGEVASGPHHAIALGERALLAMKRDEWDRAQALADQAGGVMRRARIDESIATPFVRAVQARVALHRGDRDGARQLAIGATRLRPWLSHTVPFIAAQARIELARVHLELGDLPGALTLIREIDEVLRERPDLGTLVAEADVLRAQVLGHGRDNLPGGPSTLTVAELRVLPFLPTHLTYQEIADELWLSIHTIHAQARAIFRKLGATSRSQAVARSRELGLLDS